MDVVIRVVEQVVEVVHVLIVLILARIIVAKIVVLAVVLPVVMDAEVDVLLRALADVGILVWVHVQGTALVDALVLVMLIVHGTQVIISKWQQSIRNLLLGSLVWRRTSPSSSLKTANWPVNTAILLVRTQRSG